FCARFSRTGKRLLTCLSGSGIFLCLVSANQLKSNGLRIKESSMPPVATQSRTELKNQDKWNVEALYLTPEDWTAEFEALKGGGGGLRWPEIASYKGHLSDPSSVASLFELYFGLDRKLSKLHTYAHLRMDE